MGTERELGRGATRDKENVCGLVQSHEFARERNRAFVHRVVLLGAVRHLDDRHPRALIVE